MLSSIIENKNIVSLQETTTDSLNLNEITDQMEVLKKATQRRVKREIKNSGINKLNRSIIFKNEKLKEHNLVTASICSGGGASEESMRQLGFTKENHTNLFMCEWDERVANVYKENFKSLNYFKDFYKVDWKKVEDYKINLLFISAPCQEFSIASGVRRGLQSEKGQLYIDALIKARELSPDKIINENVAALLSSGRHYALVAKENGEQIELNYIPKKEVLEENNWILIESEEDRYVYKSHFNPKLTIGRTFKIIEEMLINDFGDYNIYVDILNTKDFNTPQNRSRCFLILIKKELDLGFKFPQKEELTTRVSDLLEDEVDQSLIINDREIIVYPPKEYQNNKQINYYGEVKNKTGAIGKHRASKVIVNPIISPCLTTSGHTKINDNGVIRYLSPTEQKRLHGFSEGYKLPTHNLALCSHIMGNTLSPVVMKKLIICVLFMDNQTIARKSSRVIIHRNISSKNSMNYLNLKEEIAEQYHEFIKDGGEIIVKINLYDSVEDKRTNTNKETYIIKIEGLEQLGYVNKKYKTRRYKITGKVLKNNFLLQRLIRPNNIKNKDVLNDYKTQLFNNVSTLGLKRNTVVSVINYKNKIVLKQLSMMNQVKSTGLNTVDTKHSNNTHNIDQVKAA